MAQKFDQQTQVKAAVCVVLLIEVAHNQLCEIGVLVPEAQLMEKLSELQNRAVADLVEATQDVIV